MYINIATVSRWVAVFAFVLLGLLMYVTHASLLSLRLCVCVCICVFAIIHYGLLGGWVSRHLDNLLYNVAHWSENERGFHAGWRNDTALAFSIAWKIRKMSHVECHVLVLAAAAAAPYFRDTEAIAKINDKFMCGWFSKVFLHTHVLLGKRTNLFLNPPCAYLHSTQAVSLVEKDYPAQRRVRVKSNISLIHSVFLPGLALTADYFFISLFRTHATHPPLPVVPTPSRFLCAYPHTLWWWGFVCALTTRIKLKLQRIYFLFSIDSCAIVVCIGMGMTCDM